MPSLASKTKKKHLPKKLYAYYSHGWLTSGRKDEIVTSGRTKRVGVYELTGYVTLTARTVVQ